ncbi:hypothetical protein OIU78_027441 [Salix suchowensis]|nr:hypothetical protein OIU78_027441 [Salix suchowensis]
MAGIMQKIEETFGGKKEEQRKGEPQAGLGQQGHNTQGGTSSQGVLVAVLACTRVRHKVGMGSKATTHKVGTGNKGTTLKVSARKGSLTISRTSSRGVLVAVACTRVRHKVGTGSKGTTHRVDTGNKGQQGYNAQGERKEGFVDNIKDKLPGGVGGGGMHKGETQGGYGQQGHNTQGGYGQQGYNAQGERKEGFVDNIKDKIPGGVAVLVAVACARVRHKVRMDNKGTTNKVGTGNKGTTLKVSARKGLLTRSSIRSRGVAVVVLMAEEKGRSRTTENSSAVTATKHLALLPCTRHGQLKDVEVAFTRVTDYHTKIKKTLLCSILCFPFFKWITVVRQGRM